jgi:hypothetical protein
MEVLLGVTTLVLTATLGVVWFSRARRERRFNAALDAYAARELDLAPRGNLSRRVPSRPPHILVKGEGG